MEAGVVRLMQLCIVCLTCFRDCLRFSVTHQATTRSGAFLSYTIGCHLVGPVLLQVVSFRRHFQDYLMRSLEASNEVKSSKAKVEAELAR